MKQLTAFFFACSIFSPGCQTIDGLANQTAQTQNAEQPTVIKNCQPKINSQSTQIDLRRVRHIVHVEFVNANKIWLVTLFKEIYSTEDAGKSWKKLQLQNAEHFETLEFFNEQLGWLADVNKNVWKTNDGGKNWNQIYSFKNVKERDFLNVKKIKFTSADNGWLHETFSIFRTTDGGKNWNTVNQITEPPHEMFFADDAHGWVSFRENWQKTPLRILRTADSGKTWKKGKIQSGNLTETLYFLDERKGWFGNEDYELFSTADAGENWSKINLNVKDFLIKSMFWLNSAQGWLAGAIIDPNKPVSDAAANIPTVLSTIDGGQSWSKYEMPSDERFFGGVHFTDAANGWLVSQKAIYKTTDGGKNWKPIVKIDLSCFQ